MLTLIGTLLTSILSGGATGLLGMLLQRFFDMKSKQQDIDVIKLNLANAIELKKIDIEIAAQEWAARAQIADKEMLGKIEAATQDREAREAEAEAALQQASYNADRATYLTPEVIKSKTWYAKVAMTLVDATRGLIRPGLTVYLVVLAHFMYNDLQVLLIARNEQLSGIDVQTLSMQVIGTLLYLATTAVVWWFGTRPPKRPGDK